MLSIPTDRKFCRTACLRSISSTLDVLYVRISTLESFCSEGPNRAAPSRVRTTYIITACEVSKGKYAGGPFSQRPAVIEIGDENGCTSQLVFRMVHMICCVHDMHIYMFVAVSLDTICSRLCTRYVALDTKCQKYCWTDCRDFYHDYLTTMPSYRELSDQWQGLEPV